MFLVFDEVMDKLVLTYDKKHDQKSNQDRHAQDNIFILNEKGHRHWH